MLVLRKTLLPLCFLIVSITITGCKTRLAPEYDKAIVETVSITSEATMRFFALVAQGTTANDFSKREDTYNHLIGAYDALKIKAKARPVPKHIATKKINELLGTRGNTLSGDYPSAFAFEALSKTLRKMKDKDKSTGIKPTAIQAFKGQIEIFLDQALTYESFLKR